MQSIKKNPFVFGYVLSGSELIDREAEVARVVQSLKDGQRLFMIGPRRFGKTSVLNAAKDAATAAGVPTVMVNVETVLSLAQLAGSIIAAIGETLPMTLRERSLKLLEWFAALKPNITYDPLSDAVSVGITPVHAEQQTLSIVEALNRLDAIAAQRGTIIGIIIDEFQEVSKREGVSAERQLRACIQEHRNLAYVFSGSDMSMMVAMTAQYNRPFYRMGASMWIEAIPREDMTNFITSAMDSVGITIDPGVCAHIFDLADDIPYNIQKLAAELWTSARLSGLNSIERSTVDAALAHLVQQDALTYQTLFATLPKSRQRVLVAMTKTEVRTLPIAVMARRIDVPVSTVRSAVKVLVDQDILRPILGAEGHTYVDPFFARWISSTYS